MLVVSVVYSIGSCVGVGARGLRVTDSVTVVSIQVAEETVVV